MYIYFINFFLQDNSEENDAVLRGDIVNIVYDKAVEEIQGDFIYIFFFHSPSLFIYMHIYMCVYV